jgi:hypothetical protein
MGLRYLDSDKEVSKQPHPDIFAHLLDRKRMTEEEYRSARAEIHRMIDESLGKKEILTSGWMPGNDWTDGPFQPIYEKAAQHSYELSGKLFGLLVFDVFRERPEDWITGRFEMNGRDIGSLTYFTAGGK